VRAAAVAVFLGFILCGCGYVGPVVPPSPKIPNAVTDLQIAERGSDLVVTFTTPSRTVDNLAISKFSTIELRIGPDIRPVNMDRWVASSKEFDLPLPPPNEKDVARPVSMTYKTPASDWSGQHIAVAVRTAVKKNEKNYSNWSNFQHLEVLPPLAAPVVSVIPTAQGYKLTWNDEGAGIGYKVFRQVAPDQPPTQIGTSDKPEYVDTSAQYGTPYIYSVVAAKNTTESVSSNKVAVNAPDTFPPAPPTGVTALATGDSIELSWHRNSEPDLQGYIVYRSANGGPFERLGAITNLPAYTDLKVQHGTTYRYQVSAIDRTNNESDKSVPAEVMFP
jgi:fibronectin type 3 domain-containing protein